MPSSPSTNAKEVFFGLRDDIEKLALGQYFCALAAELAPEMEPAGDFLRVVLNSLHLLEKQMRSCRFLKAVTELKLLSLAGFMPDLTVCRHCEKAPSGDMAFNVPEQDEKKLAEVCEKFLLAQTGRTFKALDFYKSLNA